MNETQLIKIKEKMTSLEIAEITGKNHSDLLKAIRKMEESWIKVNGRNFSLVSYRDKKGEKRPMYELAKTECLYIATKFNDEARAKLVLRWEELEQKYTYADDPIINLRVQQLKIVDRVCMLELKQDELKHQISEELTEEKFQRKLAERKAKSVELEFSRWWQRDDVNELYK